MPVLLDKTASIKCHDSFLLPFVSMYFSSVYQMLLISCISLLFTHFTCVLLFVVLVNNVVQTVIRDIHKRACVITCPVCNESCAQTLDACLIRTSNPLIMANKLKKENVFSHADFLRKMTPHVLPTATVIFTRYSEIL